MSPLEHEGVMLDMCSQCQALWLDRGELVSLVGGVGELVDRGDGCAGRRCPTCSAELEVRGLADGGGLRIDVCPRCDGLFLDSGELQQARRVASRRLRRLVREDGQYSAALAAEARRRKRRRPPAQGLVGLDMAHSSGSYLLAFLAGVPLEEDSHTTRRPVMVIGLAVVMLVLWMWQRHVGVAESIASWGMTPSRVLAGEGLAAVLTSMFLHAGFLHLAGNLYFLWLFGDDVEERVGSGAFLGWYLLWGLCGELLTLALDGAGSVPYIGASGAIAGVMGAYMVFLPRARLVVPFLGAGLYGTILRLPAWLAIAGWGVLQLWLGLLEVPGVGWWAHLGGLLGGVAVGLLTKARSR